ncbi:MAG: 2-amino-4-hydroxy-6-hydroxymethyldihydropteridine diphosphokinase [Ichthyobacteriaceae bacterium]|nr:2-amino-4-hydroxy-6-hydroxymethyldihydropteridine diphosphokinase [Ichthyobacteriaceae bacterium]
MRNTYLILGSNLGNSIEVINLAIEEVNKEVGLVIAKSSFYKTAPWGFESKNDFYNIVLKVSTNLKPQVQLRTFLNIEKTLGRTRSGKDGYESRIIDIDILLIDDLIINTEALIVPHPRMNQRMFTLMPLAEIDGNIVHPIENKTIKQILNECKDDSEVEIVVSDQ